MSLPVPNLDDRRFQDLVDDAKRLVQQRCPEWTDHNVSDPGVTLIETFAFMVDQLLYRLNRVPDRNYVKFLEMLGVRLFPPTAARAGVTFWLSAPQENAVQVPADTQVSSPPNGTDEPVVFSTVAPLAIVPCSFEAIATQIAGTDAADTTDRLGGDGFPAFKAQPDPGDELLIGLSDPVPSCAVALRFDARIEGVGVDPLDPPIVWEAWNGQTWLPCEVDRDDTGGFNRPGDVIVHVPAGHEASVVAMKRAGWIRARVVEPEPGQPFYSSSPRIIAVEAFTVGGTAPAVHAQLVDAEEVGASTGVPGQWFPLRHRPVVPADVRPVLEVSVGEGWEPWTQVEDFAHSAPDDRHFLLDMVTGEIHLGPAVRQPDGSLLQYGAVPPKGAMLRFLAYRTGGGARGNVTRGALSLLKTNIPLITSVGNRWPASGGVDGEDIENAKVRGPIVLRTRNRAVTIEDYEHLARVAAPEVARVRAVPAGDGAEAGGVRVLVVPAAAEDEGEGLRFEQLVPDDATLAAIAAYLEPRRCVGARAIVEPPFYQGVTVVARIRAKPNANPERLRADAVTALNAYFHPLTGGPAGDGWPFGRPINVGEVYSVLQHLNGTEFVEDARLYPADPITGDRSEVATRIELSAHALVFSYEHQIRVEQ